jgi:hypothetical protein
MHCRSRVSNKLTNNRIFVVENYTTTNGSSVIVFKIAFSLSGICTAVRCLNLPGRVNLEIIEANKDVGGVWLTNTYPGLKSDATVYNYSYSFHPKLGKMWNFYFSCSINIT